MIVHDNIKVRNNLVFQIHFDKQTRKQQRSIHASIFAKFAMSF